MKKFFRFGAASAVVSASLSMSTVAHAADTASADAFAEILTALELTNDTDLNFGSMVVSVGGGIVTLNAVTNSLDCGEPNILCSGTTAFVAFSMSGTLGKAVTINLSGLPVVLARTGRTPGEPVDRLELSNFNSSAPVNSTGAVGFYEVTLDEVGDGTFTVGGELFFDGNENPGTLLAVSAFLSNTAKPLNAIHCGHSLAVI
jgi:hypothetical protein